VIADEIAFEGFIAEGRLGVVEVGEIGLICDGWMEDGMKTRVGVSVA